MNDARFDVLLALCDFVFDVSKSRGVGEELLKAGFVSRVMGFAQRLRPHKYKRKIERPGKKPIYVYEEPKGRARPTQRPKPASEGRIEWYRTGSGPRARLLPHMKIGGSWQPIYPRDFGKYGIKVPERLKEEFERRERRANLPAPSAKSEKKPEKKPERKPEHPKKKPTRTKLPRVAAQVTRHGVTYLMDAKGNVIGRKPAEGELRARGHGVAAISRENGIASALEGLSAFCQDTLKKWEAGTCLTT